MTQYEISLGSDSMGRQNWEAASDTDAIAAFQMIAKKMGRDINVVMGHFDAQPGLVGSYKKSNNYEMNHVMCKIRSIPAPAPVVKTKKIITCKSCGNTGSAGSYPFSTCPNLNLCDDCV